MYSWNIISDNKCWYCSEIDTIEHHFVYWRESRGIWDGIEKWIYENLDIKFKFTVCEIIFGLANAKELGLQNINFIILLAKWYINKTKTNNESLRLFTFLQELRNKIEGMINTTVINDKPVEPWLDHLFSVL